VRRTGNLSSTPWKTGKSASVTAHHHLTIHMRVKNRRNLFRAVPVKVHRPSTILNNNEQKHIDQNWKAFWAKRGYTKPPVVSAYILGVFDLPTPKKGQA